MAILKIGMGRDNGVYGTIASMKIVPPSNPKFPPQYECTLESGDVVFMNKDPLERQAARLELLPNELVGIPLVFWKKPMDDDPNKGYLNIEKATKPTGNAVRGAAMDDDYVGRDLRANGVPIKATTFEQIKDQYVETLGAAVSLAGEFEAFTDGKPLTEAGVLSIAATLFIERNRKGV